MKWEIERMREEKDAVDKMRWPHKKKTHTHLVNTHKEHTHTYTEERNNGSFETKLEREREYRKMPASAHAHAQNHTLAITHPPRRTYPHCVSHPHTHTHTRKEQQLLRNEPWHCLSQSEALIRICSQDLLLSTHTNTHKIWEGRGGGLKKKKKKLGARRRKKGGEGKGVEFGGSRNQ